ncbi:hypothetical protein B857_02674 [Solibacillus isronensis B3W22]|uniref:Uncharacterized protein n=1 Tax=Solibacillus isronensis B3W22 TaxID=1224748 RepID=K1KXD4_9BACL|nr:hypothetical protein SOLI23_07330 [Solibacillus silvestris]EKB44572.1 hypothetical protein B857_02674 [Solibacillus isronensis B3W22]
MKILGISILMFLLLSGISIGMDSLLGFDLKTSFKNAVNPFLVMEVTEIIIFYFLIIIWVYCSIRLFLIKRSKKR